MYLWILRKSTLSQLSEYCRSALGCFTPDSDHCLFDKWYMICLISLFLLFSNYWCHNFETEFILWTTFFIILLLLSSFIRGVKKILKKLFSSHLERQVDIHKRRRNSSIKQKKSFQKNRHSHLYCHTDRLKLLMANNLLNLLKTITLIFDELRDGHKKFLGFASKCLYLTLSVMHKK